MFYFQVILISLGFFSSAIYGIQAHDKLRRDVSNQQSSYTHFESENFHSNQVEPHNFNQPQNPYLHQPQYHQQPPTYHEQQIHHSNEHISYGQYTTTTKKPKIVKVIDPHAHHNIFPTPEKFPDSVHGSYYNDGTQLSYAGVKRVIMKPNKVIITNKGEAPLHLRYEYGSKAIVKDGPIWEPVPNLSVPPIKKL